MRDLADFLPFVLPFAPNVPDPVAEKYIREAAIEFCERTRAWRMTDRFPVHGHRCEVFPVPQYAVIHDVDHARFYATRDCHGHGQKVERKPLRDIDEGACSEPVITEVDQQTVVFWTPQAGWVRLAIFMKPSLDAEGLDPFLFDRFGRQIGWGALATIMMLPNQPFTSPQMATFYAGKFQQVLDTNFDLALRGQQRAPYRTTARYL